MEDNLLNDTRDSADARNEKLLIDIANEEVSETIALDLIAKDKTINQMKLFILVQAKRELQRVIKLTKFLDKVEDAYQNKVEENLESYSLKQYNDIIYTINQCLSRANDIIKSVIKDNELSNILIYTDNSSNTVNNIIGSNNSVHGLESPESRDRVIKAVNNILSRLNSIEDENNKVINNSGDNNE